MTPEQNLQLMQTLDDSWNAQDWKTFSKRHAKDCVVYWPNQPPTLGIVAHEQEGVEMFKTFPDNRVGNRPYKVMFAQGEWTCTIAEFTGTMKGPMKGADGKMISPTNKSFKVDFCTVAHWVNGEIVEENLFYDVIGLLKQIGLMKGQRSAWKWRRRNDVSELIPAIFFGHGNPINAVMTNGYTEAWRRCGTRAF